METTSPVEFMDPRPARQGWRRAAGLFGFWTLIGLIFATVSYAVTFAESTRRIGFTDALRLNLVQFYLWAPFSLLIFWFSRRFPVDFQARRIRNLLLHVPVLLVFALAHQAIQIVVLWSVMPRMRQQFPTLAEYYRAYFGFGFYIDLLIGSLIIIAVHALLYYQRFRASELEQASLKTQLAHAHLRALKMQLHPHFLFNTLHSISSLVLEDPPKANSMIARLGDFLRLTLEQSDEQLVSLENEMEFLHCYLDIEQVRFGDRLTVNFAIEPRTLSAQVPHLILQPVVENAIQHAIAPRATLGRIEIGAKRGGHMLEIAVRDTGPGIARENGSFHGHGVGLANVQARLRQIYDRDFVLEMNNNPEGGLTVLLQLPFRLETSATPEESR